VRKLEFTRAYITKQERNLEMLRTRVLTSILMISILVTLSGASVWAAPEGQQEEPTTIIGVVEEIDFDEETNTVLVTLVDELGETHKLSMSLEKAIELELVDENGDPIVNIGEDVVEIPLSDDIEVIEEDEEAQHPVASALAKYFASLIPALDYDTVMGYHEDGMGFGVIAQACWMSYALEGDVTLLGDILAAKKSHDFSSIELPEGVETPKNWGQFRKVVLGSEKAKKNLGAIMSQVGKEQDETGGDELGAAANQAQGKGKKGKGPGEDGPPGKNKDKGGKGGGPPAVPPGQEKDKDKGGGKGKGK
jgi:hypothetical protein